MTTPADPAQILCCGKCGGSDFNRYKQCRACVRERTLAWRTANKERLDDYSVRYRAEHRDEILAQKSVHWAANKDRLNEQRRVERMENPERVRALQRAKYRRNHGRIRAQAAARYALRADIILARNRRWRAANSEKVYASIDRYSREHPEVVRAAKRAWKRRNPEAVRTEGRVRNGRKRNGRLSPGLIKTLLKLQRGKCPCCGKPLGARFHLDHIVPLARGGEHADANMQLMRDVCNMQKSAKHPVDFMQSRGFLL